MYKKVLVANRGEIAVRIIRALHELNIKAVAIYSTADKEALHVQLADEAIGVGGPKPQDSYLNRQNIVSAALLTGAEAVHPGYGFLSENAMFVNMLHDVGIDFIGPRAETIDLMGDKAAARETMRAAGIPVIPGSIGTLATSQEAAEISAEIGYPVMLKAAAGGGGKGMRFIPDATTLVEQFDRAQAEAVRAFGSGEMYVEKVMTDVRHIEVQIMRDASGQTVYFPERDCSIQRNHQKMIEMSPAVGITSDIRENLGQLAVKAANALNYVNTGTFEFLADRDNHFYFMEMNTRIQVEHPVTEAVTGLDLVKMQILVAAGEPLPVAQQDIQVKQHAVEVRLNAENPHKNFQPSAGQISFSYLPFGGPGVRFDSAIYTGEEIAPYYDSMIGKVIVSANSRDEVFTKLSRTLDEVVIHGIDTNLSIQRDLVHNQAVQQGIIPIDFVETTFLPAWSVEEIQEP
ncbi:acetyl-CoA carboxylase biotin carboxylase subunit [Weissella cibaria]|uniref:biotin carboxylase n=1 Tax=Weissella cibaria TaxID=137591 RepID=A0A0D1M9X2_9LACO|nr:acetyl-CoA carboxylase biotin carboxylase subunit [Weissella cibaria]ALI33429.1 acetyl-CoA carboxylase biotin carboxylase subunit [Weissella cibaria]KIU19704.1 Biotin carboxylase [Weissella cibaria]KIU24701.1 Biotin carboxylase [Weissella cibaria]MDV8928960.1 acetyl-CoA carboxylase biotin carboxylase subunit [Weissella cibaria]MDY2520365.1 acetyl-CoA carboxylase biotin carboxylase subunit [Weissella cibaria]